MPQKQKGRLLNAIKEHSSNIIGFREVSRAADYSGEVEGSRFRPKYGEGKVKIDCIFTTLPTDPSASFAIEDTPEDGIYISDHRSIMALLIFKSNLIFNKKVDICIKVRYNRSVIFKKYFFYGGKKQ